MSKDNWSSKAYSNAASFVPQLTAKVLEYLAPQPTDHILDIGCGDGVLNDKIAPLCSKIIGLDSSSSMIKTANEIVKPKHSNVEFIVADCRRVTIDSSTNLDADASRALGETYDKVFSNAAMHWILRDESTRLPFFSDVHHLLKPGGAFVFEMGGFGNISDVHVAIYATLSLKYGIALDEIRAADPWFFPSKEWMTSALEGAGFTVEKMELEHRPTRANKKQEDGSGGIEGWLRLMGATFLQLLSEMKRDEAVRDLCDILNTPITKVEDNSQWLNYVRLRAVARKA